MIWRLFRRRNMRLPMDALGIDWNAMKRDESGLSYFDIGDGVRLYPWTWNPIFDVMDTKRHDWPGCIVEENVAHTHPIYGRELYRRYLLPGRHNNVFPQDRPATSNGITK